MAMAHVVPTVLNLNIGNKFNISLLVDPCYLSLGMTSIFFLILLPYSNTSFWPSMGTSFIIRSASFYGQSMQKVFNTFL